MAVKYLTIKAGESGVIKANSKVLSVVVTGSAEADSTCVNLPAPEPLICFSLKWAVETDDGGGTGPWSVGDNDAKLSQIVIADITYNADLPIDGGFPPLPFTDPSELEEYVDNNIPPSVMTAVDLTRSTVGEREEMTFAFLAPASLGTKTYFKFTSPGLSLTSGAIIYAEQCADCCGGGVS